MQKESEKFEQAMFGAGCFWSVEDAFLNTKGIVNTAVGFSGGDLKNPTYEQTTTGKTGHAEVVWMEYNPEIVSYEKLLDIFWNRHNPTTLNRQKLDIGTQYRSVIFYYSEDQRERAKKSKQSLEESKKYKDPIVTEISPAREFYKAEEYHQKYVQKGGICHY